MIFCFAICPSQLTFTIYNPDDKLITLIVWVWLPLPSFILVESWPFALNISYETGLLCQVIGIVIFNWFTTGFG